VNGIALSGPRDVDAICSRIAGSAPADAASIEVVVKVRRLAGATDELHVTLPLSDRPQIGIMPFEGTRIRAIAPGRPLAKEIRVQDEVLRINGEPVEDLQVLRHDFGSAPLSELVLQRNGAEVSVPVPDGLTVRDFADTVSGGGLTGAYVSPRHGMPAEKAGLRAGDRVVKAGGQEIASFSELHQAITSASPGAVQIVVERGGEQRTLEIEPGRFPEWPSLGYGYAVAMTEFQAGPFTALRMGWSRTVMSIKTVVLTIRGLITQRVSSKHIGGPIALAQTTYTVWEQGLGRYLYILALLSVNLAILNILPIPILDGGQIVLLCAEKLRGKPLPERLVGYYQMVGLVLILGLLFLVFKNDITRMLQ
jgi:RIP metalloprotease RseP